MEPPSGRSDQPDRLQRVAIRYLEVLLARAADGYLCQTQRLAVKFKFFPLTLIKSALALQTFHHDPESNRWKERCLFYQKIQPCCRYYPSALDPHAPFSRSYDR